MLYRTIVLLSLLLVSQTVGAAAAAVSITQTHEIPDVCMPLGGVWVHTLPEHMQVFHAKAVRTY
jgi:hypothetical protein